MTKSVLLVFGTRPEAIKLAPVYRALQQQGTLKPMVCLTGQHREMIAPVLKLFDIRPDVDLALMRPGQTLGDLTGRMLVALDPVLQSLAPDVVVVQGDTTSTLCGGLAAFYRRIPVAHVEAGLRTGDMHSPFPEELNRVATTRVATWHFAATAANRDQLLAEGVPDEQIFVTGNPVIDALFEVRDRIDRGCTSEETRRLCARFTRRFVLITGHRRESFGPGFARICQAIRSLAERFPDVDWVYPVHLNPQVQRPVHEALGCLANVHLLPPQSYEPFVALMCRAELVLTDSGGVQEEAPALGKPTLVMREKTERTECLGSGATLVGTSVQRIVSEASSWLSQSTNERIVSSEQPYGDGQAARRIAGHLAEALSSPAVPAA